MFNYLANAIIPSNAHMFYKYDEKRDYGVEEPEIFAVYNRIILSKCLFLCCHRFTVNLTRTVRSKLIFLYSRGLSIKYWQGITITPCKLTFLLFSFGTKFGNYCKYEDYPFRHRYYYLGFVYSGDYVIFGIEIWFVQQFEWVGY